MLDEKLASASRKELRQHIALQQDLIRRLHTRVVDLEVALEEEYTRLRTITCPSCSATFTSQEAEIGHGLRRGGRRKVSHKAPSGITTPPVFSSESGAAPHAEAAAAAAVAASDLPPCPPFLSAFFKAGGLLDNETGTAAPTAFSSDTATTINSATLFTVSSRPPGVNPLPSASPAPVASSNDSDSSPHSVSPAQPDACDAAVKGTSFPFTSASSGLSEINRVLDAHAAQKPTLSPEVVAELLLIRSTLLRDVGGSLAHAIHTGKMSGTSRSENETRGGATSLRFSPLLTPLKEVRGVVNPKWVSPEEPRVVYGKNTATKSSVSRRQQPSLGGLGNNSVRTPLGAADSTPPVATSLHKTRKGSALFSSSILAATFPTPSNTAAAAAAVVPPPSMIDVWRIGLLHGVAPSASTSETRSASGGVSPPGAAHYGDSTAK